MGGADEVGCGEVISRGGSRRKYLGPGPQYLGAVIEAPNRGAETPIGVNMGKGYSPSHQTKWFGVISSPSGVRGRAPAVNTFWHILRATERLWFNYFLRLMCLQKVYVFTLRAHFDEN